MCSDTIIDIAHSLRCKKSTVVTRELEHITILTLIKKDTALINWN